MLKSLSRESRYLGAAIALCAVVYGIGIGSGSHHDSDDTLYASMARQMVETGNWLDNQWSGRVVFEKPPVYLWSLALSGAMFGWNEAAMRLPGTLFALGALIAFFYLMLGLGASLRQTLTGLGLLATSVMFVWLTRRLMMDVPLLCCTLASAAFLVRGRTIGFGVWAGLAVMVKGAGAGPVLLALVIFGMMQRLLDWRSLAKAVGVALLIVAPWHLIETFRHGGDFWRDYIVHHVFERATSKVVRGTSIIGIINVLMTDVMPVALGLVGIFVAASRRFKAPLERFAITWLLCTVIPLLLSTTILIQYALPLFPPLILLALAVPAEEHWNHRLAPAVAAFLIVMSIGMEPGRARLIWNADFSPHAKAVGEVIAEESKAEDYIAVHNVMSNSVTYYANRRFDMLTDVDGFYSAQETVAMIARSGVLKWIDEKAGQIDAPSNDGRRFVMTSAVTDDESDQRVIKYMKAGAPERALYRRVIGNRVLINDAGVGDPIP